MKNNGRSWLGVASGAFLAVVVFRAPAFPDVSESILKGQPEMGALPGNLSEIRIPEAGAPRALVNNRSADAAAARRLTAERLMRMTEDELAVLYSAGVPDPIPNGSSDGAASGKPGTPVGGYSEEFFNKLWKGKVFDRQQGILRNRILGHEMVDAKVYVGKSLFDGKDSIILDYSQSSTRAARGIRDEIRLVDPDVYLGIAYVRFPPVIGSYGKWLFFALDFNKRQTEIFAEPSAQTRAGNGQAPGNQAP